MQVKTTKKLFYSKYPFKVECRLSGASYITRYGIDKCLLICGNEKLRFSTGGMWFRNNDNVDKVSMALFIKAYQKIKDCDIKVRTEGSHFNIFCQDEDTYEKIKKELSKWITFLYQPESKEVLDFMLANGPRKVIVKQLPREKYKYKITVRSNMPVDARKQFIKWTEKYDKDIFSVSNTSKQWMLGNKVYAQDPFFYIQDNSVLTLTSLFLGNNIKKIEEFVIADTISEA